MTTFLEGPHTAAFFVSEANGTLSRESIIVASGQDLAAGAVLGQITADSTYRAVQPGATDGSEVAAGILYAAVDATLAAQAGAAVVRLAEVNLLELVWPDGITGGQKTTALSELATFTGSRGAVIAR